MNMNAIRAEHLASLISDIESALNLAEYYSTNFTDREDDNTVFEAREALAALVQRLRSAEDVLESLRACTSSYEENV
jgi:hypothetical protein